MRRFVVFSDIHGNIEALKAIYSDILSYGISEIYHLGDAIAIGPEPKLTIDFILSNNGYSAQIVKDVLNELT